MNIPNDDLIPYMVTNLISVLLVPVAYHWPKATRWFFAIFFTGAGLVNIFNAFSSPELYIVGTRQAALFGIYRNFIDGVFSQYTTLLILLISLGQLLSGNFLAFGGRWLLPGAAGTILFLAAIAPLGAFSSFPATLIWAGAVYLTYCRLSQEPVLRAGAHEYAS